MSGVKHTPVAPCPWCGGNAKCNELRRGNYRREGDNYQVVCNKCRARGPLVQDSQAEAIAAWNQPARARGEQDGGWGMTYIRVEQSERLVLRDKVGEIAIIALGQHNGQWFFSVSHQQRTGDMWGYFGGIGYREGERGADSRDDALAAAIAHARTRWANRTREMAAHIAWLDTLIPSQPDLFGAAA